MSDLLSELAGSLADRYAIERELGHGGMATVFLARDLKHDRPVALKVLHPELAATLGPERFQREIRLAARLHHPHICGVLDSGEAGGRLWFTMPYLEGESLRERLARERQLSIDEAVRITREAALGLAFAHQRGVVHRDVKPENILLTTDGQALVADFGIAKALTQSPTPGSSTSTITGTGVAIGTPTYMSPEQASGARDVDARSDVYSLACMLYEMLAGEPPFTGPTAQAILAKRLSTDAPAVTVVRAGVPPPIAAAIARALSRTPADRFANAQEFGRALEAGLPSGRNEPGGSSERGDRPVRHDHAIRRAALTYGLGLLVGLGVLFAWRQFGAGHGPSGIGNGVRLAVLPFENLGSQEDEYFADGMTDEVRGKLSALPGLQVIASGSASQYKRTTKTPEQIARELEVDYLLVGKVRWEKAAGGASRVRVSPELVDVAGGKAPTTRWQEPFDAALTDVFQVQADIAGRVAQALDVALGARERQTIAQRPTANLAAYDAFLKGEEASQSLGTTEATALHRAIAHYQAAVALDSTFVAAWTQLSRAHSYLYGNGAPLPATAEQAKRAADRALLLAPNRFEGPLALGDYNNFVTGDYSQAMREYAMGQQAAPTNVDLLANAALAQMSLGQWEAAFDNLTRASQLDPRSVNTVRRLCSVLLLLRRYPEALAAADRALTLAPDNLTVIENKVLLYLMQGDLASGRAFLKDASRRVDPTVLVVYVAQFNDLAWVLDDEQRAFLMRLTPAAFDNNRGAWGLCLAQAYAVGANSAKARIYGDSARIALEAQAAATPGDAQTRSLLGVALAYMGRKTEAIREGEAAVAMVPIPKDAWIGPYLQFQLARIYLLVGEPDKALDQVEPLLKIPYFLSPAWLRIDPMFKPLRGNPRFERLAAGR